MSDIMVYVAMFSTTIVKILCFKGPPKMKMSHYKIEANFCIYANYAEKPVRYNPCRYHAIKL